MTADVPIYFRSLELENVRCFAQRQCLDFTDKDGKPVQWIVILGDNGVGKTTLLQCLGWMRPAPRKDESGKLEAIDPVLNDEENPVLRSLIRRRDDARTTVRTTLKAEFSVGQKLGQSNGIQDHDEITTTITLEGTPWDLKDRVLAEAHPEKFENTPFLDVPMFAYGATRRPGTLKQEDDTLSDPIAPLYRESAELYDAEEILEQFDYRAAKTGEQQDKDRLKKVKEILAAVLPDVNGAANIEVLAPPAIGHESKRSGVQFKTPYATVPLSSLSLGYQTMLTWVLDLVLRLYRRYPDSDDPLSQPGIVLIDELDLHLHPIWQRQVMDYLAGCFPAIQFVVTAHSPLIAQAAKDAKLVVLNNQDGEIIIRSDFPPVDALRSDQILTGDLFGVPSSRGRRIEDLRKERNALLDIRNRSHSDEARLQSLREELDRLSTAEDAEGQAAMDLIRDIANELRASRSNGS